MREQTLIPGFASRFCFVELTLGRMPRFTKRSRASTFQVMSARLSENGTMKLLPRILLFLDTLQRRVIDGSEGVAAFGFGFSLCNNLMTLSHA